MIVYGKNVFDQLKEQPEAIEEIYAAKGIRDQKLLKQLAKLPNVRWVAREKLDAMTGGAAHQGIAAKVRKIRMLELDELMGRLPKDRPGFLVALDGIQDPHNLGAILRTADCAGADGVIVTKHNSAGLTPTAIKTSTGAAYTVPVAGVSSMAKALQTLKEKGFWIAGTDMQGARDYRKGMYTEPTVIVIGSEGKGMSPLVKKQCDYMVKLPMKGAITSLNASVAAALLLYEVLNQREPAE